MNYKTVIDYFDRKAKNYEAGSQSWPWSVVRKWEADVVQRMMGNVDGRSFIDLGAGSGYYVRIFMALGAVDISAVDMSAKMLTGVPPGARTHLADITSISLDYTFDRILCAGALEFVVDPDAVLRNARALAAEDCRMVVLVPNSNLFGLLYKLFHKSHGVRLNLFRPKSLRDMADLAGWRVDRVERVAPFSLVACMSLR